MYTFSWHRINSRIITDIISEPLLPSNASDLLKNYDVILDCTDNAPARYLLSDTAVHLGKPLVSGGAEKYGGQVCIYNFGKDGPCYRCHFPDPGPPSGGCQQTGILGVVTGIIGSIQALQAIKIITGLYGTQYFSRKINTTHASPLDGKPTVIYFTALGFPLFHNYELNSKSPTCAACGSEGEKIGEIQNIDYLQWCGITPNWVETGLVGGGAGHRIRVQVFRSQWWILEIT